MIQVLELTIVEIKTTTVSEGADGGGRTTVSIYYREN